MNRYPPFKLGDYMDNFSYQFSNDLKFYFSNPQQLIYFKQKVDSKNVIYNLKYRYKKLYGLNITDEMAYLLLYSKIVTDFKIECCGVILCRKDVENIINFQMKSINKLKDIMKKSNE